MRGDTLYLEAFLGIGERDLIGSRLRPIGEARLLGLLRDDERLCAFLDCCRSRDGLLRLIGAFEGGEFAGLRFSGTFSFLCSTTDRFGVRDLFLAEIERLRFSLPLLGVGDRRLGDRLSRTTFSTRFGETELRLSAFFGDRERLFRLFLLSLA